MSVGAKHLEDKLSVIAKNSSPNASPVQLSVVSCHLFADTRKKLNPSYLSQGFKVVFLRPQLSNFS
ncbi:MAG: hypothetical protein HEP80_00645 [Dolichospermum sp. UKL201]|uniref:Uncharacterized protein n=1 Tax=Dolichospermum flos-aquae CCAP 1403/13F TaxID=315271 RepID=A0A6H2BUN7_DOLFA|nr:hypothetical protein [Dolichospermum flos-aquae]QJB42811.1 hypothetical protein HGD76_00050 [Dolichospermum flos-aquae CCAP 1403/13F]QSV52481.1 MAG: hypothetical protein HEP80_00645 [Dolichospermum sp. UKL201]